MGKSSRLTIVLAGARVFCLGMLALLLTLPRDSGAGAVTFDYNGFNPNSHNKVIRKPFPEYWMLDPLTGCFHFEPPVANTSGRFLYPHSGPLKSFSTTFIYRLQKDSYTGPGMAFMMVARQQSPVRFVHKEFTEFHRTYGTPQSQEDHESDHIRYKQIWIHYSEVNSRMDIYYANYEKGKERPKEPKESQDLSHLKKKMKMKKMKMFRIGFSTAPGIDSSNVPGICAWNFSNDGGPAPNIDIAQDASPAGGRSFAVLVVLICQFSLCWYPVWRRPLRIFISHTGGPNGAGKNFPSWLHQAMTSHRRWSRSKFHVKPFLDVENCPKGLSFAGKILKELDRFDVGVVVVTRDFFSSHWPMTELIKFVEVQRKDREGRIRVLPLFYELKPDEVKQGLDQGTWENFWVEPSEDNHPLQLQECRDAVTWLCNQTGIRYVSYDRRDQDKAYIDTILKEVDKILCDERSIAADLRWAIKKLNITR